MYRSLRPGGRILLQMGGKGNAVGILAVLDEVIAEAQWQQYFANFGFPCGFYDTNPYADLLADAGFTAKRIELIPKDMLHEGRSGLEGWIRTTWLPYTQQVPIDAEGMAHVAMVRIEVEAEKCT